MEPIVGQCGRAFLWITGPTCILDAHHPGPHKRGSLRWFSPGEH